MCVSLPCRIVALLDRVDENERWPDCKVIREDEATEDAELVIGDPRLVGLIANLPNVEVSADKERDAAIVCV